MQIQGTQDRRQGYELCVFVVEGGICLERSKGGELFLYQRSGISRANKGYWESSLPDIVSAGWEGKIIPFLTLGLSCSTNMGAD